jgi:hypothetical protein
VTLVINRAKGENSPNLVTLSAAIPEAKTIPCLLYICEPDIVAEYYFDVHICTYIQGASGKPFFVASYAESMLSQGNLNQPDVAFCFMLAAIS